LLRVAADQDHIGRRGCRLEWTIHGYLQRCLARGNLRHLFHLQIRKPDHRLDEPHQFLLLGWRERHVVRVCADRTLLVIAGGGVEDLAGGGAAPVPASSGLNCRDVRQIRRRLIDERDADGRRAQTQQFHE
jgi:hypothetical protein